MESFDQYLKYFKVEYFSYSSEIHVHVTSVEQTSVQCVIFVMFCKRSKQRLTVGTHRVETTCTAEVSLGVAQGKLTKCDDCACLV